MTTKRPKAPAPKETPTLVEKRPLEPQPTGPTPTPASPVEEAFAALDRLEAVREEAINELLLQREEIDQQLARLGYQQVQVPTAAAFGEQTRPRTSRTYDPTKRCPICGETGHDARRHRFEKARTAAATPQTQGGSGEASEPPTPA